MESAEQQVRGSDLRRERVAVGDSRYEIELGLTDDGRVSLAALGHHDGEVIAELSGVLPPSDAAQLGCLIGWYVSRFDTRPRPAKTLDVEAIRVRHANAYKPWTADDDALLLELHRAGRTLSELAEQFGRHKGGIRSRLNKLGLDPKRP
jgi:hypothetical protein